MRARGSIRAALESGKRACGQVSKGARSKAVRTFPLLDDVVPEGRPTGESNPAALQWGLEAGYRAWA